MVYFVACLWNVLSCCDWLLMSEVDVMLPQERLLCGAAQKSPKPKDSEFSGRQQACGGEFISEIEKLRGFSCKPDTENGQAKRKHKRGKRRKWKPYSRLTWDERKQLEERDSRRANRIRAEMSAVGLTLAPYNTTQFLMEDHNVQEPDYEHIPRHRESTNSLDSSDDYYSSPEDEEDFLRRQFIETYESIHNERLNNMSKTDLVQELMCIEDKVESLEKKLHEERLQSDFPSDSYQDIEAQLEKIRVFRAEIQKLKEENERLRRENEMLSRRTCMSLET